MHKGTRHVGKAPEALRQSRENSDRLKSLQKKLSKAIEILWLEDGDHDLKPRKAVSGFTYADHLRTMAERVAAWAKVVARL